MTADISTTAPTEPATYAGPVCQSCGGPCWRWKGSVWGYTCTACIERYLDDGERAWQAKSPNARDRISRNLLHGNDNPNFDHDEEEKSTPGRGGSALCAASRPGVARHTELKGRVLQCL
ncbi:hypothetical protein [Mycobacterium vicinigordonae]|uniref:Uncharacterized protein n=1 Tax=Mycobacterium vicinigordonae TaxID=1719132 RepID=A0A7D6DVD3_9MYCO|nr:hypothetical protein [Mycobacterium vicinigordonae]QLL05588.1 hypothetical protein H0P51_17280 [Mycobacterium vicinigordonae]